MKGSIHTDTQTAAGGLLQPHMRKRIMENHTTGYFNIGNHLPGAATFTFALVLDGSHAVGSGTITQAVSPPLNLKTYLHGTMSSIVWGGDDTQIITLTGGRFPTPMPPNEVNVECTLQVDSKNPDKNRASLAYLDANGAWVRLENLPVRVTWSAASE